MYQEPTVFPDLTVAENVFAGRHPRHRCGTVDWRAMRRETERVLEEFGVDLGPDTPVRGLGVADRQLLEIAKALSSSARLLIMDEPTAALSPHEVENLFATVRRLRERGVAIVFISHRLEEAEAIADVVTVLRDGRHVATRPIGRASAGGDRAADGRPVARRALPQGGGGDRRRRAGGEVARTPWRLLGCLVPSSTAARSSASPASSAPAGPRSRGRIFGIDCPGRRRALDRRPPVHARARRGRRCAAASRTCPRTGSSRGSSSRCRSARTSPWPSCRA